MNCFWRRVLSLAAAAGLLSFGAPAGAAAEAAEILPMTLECEDGTMLGGAQTGQRGGVGYVDGLKADGDGVLIRFEIAQEGFYDIIVRSASHGGHKENIVAVDGVSAGSFTTDESDFTESRVKRVRLSKGEHTVSLLKSWGWVLLDSITLVESEPLPADLYEVNPAPVNPAASPNAKRLKKWLSSIYGEKVLSGQNCDTGMMGYENMAIQKTTGQYPALLGLDMIEYSPSRVANGSSGRSVDFALNYWQKGGISTFCWHWNAPEKYLTGVWYSGFYKEHTNINLKKIMDGEDPEGMELLLRDIDVISEAMKPLAEADVPILWRPLHEASGGWFWWGASDSDSYIRLYRLLYQRMTEVHGLNNLLWVWNGQHEDWYPGDDVVDLIGWGGYPGEHVYTSQGDIFLRAAACSGERKIVILSENGCVPDPDEVFADGTVWGAWCTWGGEFVLKTAGFNKLGEKYTEAAILKKAYADERVITRADLPDFSAIPID